MGLQVGQWNLVNQLVLVGLLGAGRLPLVHVRPCLYIRQASPWNLVVYWQTVLGADTCEMSLLELPVLST